MTTQIFKIDHNVHTSHFRTCQTRSCKIKTATNHTNRRNGNDVDELNKQLTVNNNNIGNVVVRAAYCAWWMMDVFNNT